VLASLASASRDADANEASTTKGEVY